MQYFAFVIDGNTSSTYEDSFVFQFVWFRTCDNNLKIRMV